MSTNWTVVLAVVCLLVVWGCGQQSNPGREAADPPAQVAHHVEEDTINTITLTEKAAQRLGIRLADVQFVEVQRRRTVGGEVVVPTGQTIIVPAPMAGVLSAPEGAAVPPPGDKLSKGQPVFSLEPLLTPERDVLTPADRVRVAQTKADVATAQIEAERQVESNKVALEAAKIAYDRAVQLLRNKAGSQRSVDEADANLKLAREALITAEARHKFLAGISLDEHPGELIRRAIESPVAGVLQSVEAAAGEIVTAGMPLFTVIKADRVWVRVPVYVGHWRDVDTEQEASIAEYGSEAGAPLWAAKYVSAPPSANPDATTVDLFYELANNDGRLRPGQKLAVTLPMRGSQKSLVAPFSAVLYDIHGGAWVYQEMDQRVYARRRVSVQYLDGANAILAAGPQPGAKVVTDGAAELFGEEFGVGH